MAGEAFHCVIRHIVLGHAKVKDLHDIGMYQAPYSLSFSLKSSPGIGAEISR